MENNKINILDKFIGYFSPSSLVKRSYYRSMLGYDAGSYTATNSNWHAPGGTAENINTMTRSILRERARDLERNSDIAKSVLLAYKRNVVGTGIKLTSKVKIETETDTINQDIETLWKEWCKKDNCEITGSLCFKEIQEMIVQRLKVDGGILIIKVNDNSKFGFKLQLKEVDDIAESPIFIPQNDNVIINGIEVNNYGKAIAYHLKSYDKNGFFTGETERITADRVLFLYRKERPSQYREVSELAQTLERLRDIDSFSESVSIKERVLACLSVFIKKSPTAGTGVGRGIAPVQNTQLPYTKLSPGMINYLSPGDDISVINPSGQASNASEFIATQQRMLGAGQGLSYEVISRDMSKSNYSSARQGMLEDQSTYKMLQHFLIEHFCEDIYKSFIDSIFLVGLIKRTDYISNPYKYYCANWVCAGFSWIDPLKEVKANQTAIETGQSTLEIICANSGYDWKDILKQQAIEKEYKLSLENKSTDGSSTGDGITIDEDQTIAQVSMNGAQISSLLQIVQSVVANQLEYDAAITLITTAFPITEEVAKKILGNVENLEKGE